MRAAIYNSPGNITVEDRPTPSAGPGEIRIRPAAVSLCASDVRVFKGEKYALPGVIPGHEIAGVIDQVGDGVKDLHEGQRVMVNPIVACNRCLFCLTGRRNRCAERLTMGYDLNGGFAEYMVVPESIVSMGHVIPVPDSIPLSLASITEPSACTLASLELCNVRAGTSMAIIGAGPMGMLHLLLGKALGAGPIIVIEPFEERRMIAKRWGADVVLDPEADDVKAAVRAETNGLGADAVVVSVGVASLVGPALDLARPQAVVNLFAGFPKGGAPVPFDPNLVHYSEVLLTGSQNATTDQYRRTLRLLGQTAHIDEVITNRYGLEEAPDAYNARLAMSGLKSLVEFPDVGD